MIARRLGMRVHFQEAFPGYGIAVLSKLPIPDTRWSLRHRATHDDKTYAIVTWVVAKR